MRPVSVLESVSQRKAGRLRGLGIESVLDLLTTVARHYVGPDPPGRRLGTAGGRGGGRAGLGAVGGHAPGPHRACRRRRRRRRRHRPAQDRLLQPALALEAARGRHRGHLLRQGDRVPGQPPDGQPGGRRGGRGDPGPAHATDPARVSGLGQGRADLVGDQPVRRPAFGAAGRSPTRWMGTGGPPSTCGAGPRPSGPSMRPSQLRRRRTGAAPAGLRRALPAAAGAGAAAPGLGGQCPRPAPRRLAAGGDGHGGPTRSWRASWPACRTS